MANNTIPRQASFRGVVFQVFTADSSFGRRLVEHTFVKRDTPYQEDLGRKAREFAVEGFVIGDDFAKQRDALIEACETEGPGQLIHPFYGTRTVSVRGFRIKESAGERRMARFDFEFVEAGQLTFPKAVISPSSAVIDSVDVLRSASTGEFLKKFNVLGKAQFVVDSARGKVEEASDAFAATTSSAATLSNSISDLAYSTRNLKADAADLINEPAELRDRIGGSIRLLTDTFATKKDSSKVHGSFYRYGSTDVAVNTTTPNRVQEKQNSSAINNLIIQESIGQSSLSVIEIPFTSMDDALASRGSLFDAIDEQMGSTDNDEIYNSLAQLKANLAKAVPSPAKNLPNIVILELPESVPSIVLAYSLYESLNKEDDIIDRNLVREPAFVPGGIPLKVLNDA